MPTTKPNPLDRLLNHIQDFTPRYRLKLRAIPLITSLVAFWLLFHYRDSFRDAVPEPLNIFNHAGNLGSTILTLPATIILGTLLLRWAPFKKKDLRVIVLSIGIFIAAFINIYVEDPAGMISLGLPNTGDTLDIVWPVALVASQIWFCLQIEDRKAKK